MAFLLPALGGLLGSIFKFEKGGMVGGGKKGKPVLAVVHTGERVLTDKQNKVYEKMMKKEGKSVSKMVQKPKKMAVPKMMKMPKMMK
jgi:predicted dinucleotide-utilizing enzyme